MTHPFLEACGATGPLLLNTESPGVSGGETRAYDLPFVLAGRRPEVGPPARAPRRERPPRLLPARRRPARLRRPGEPGRDLPGGEVSAARLPRTRPARADRPLPHPPDRRRPRRRRRALEFPLPPPAPRTLAPLGPQLPVRPPAGSCPRRQRGRLPDPPGRPERFETINAASCTRPPASGWSTSSARAASGSTVRRSLTPRSARATRSRSATRWSASWNAPIRPTRRPRPRPSLRRPIWPISSAPPMAHQLGLLQQQMVEEFGSAGDARRDVRGDPPGTGGVHQPGTRPDPPARRRPARAPRRPRIPVPHPLRPAPIDPAAAPFGTATNGATPALISSPISIPGKGVRPPTPAPASPGPSPRTA